MLLLLLLLTLYSKGLIAECNIDYETVIQKFFHELDYILKQNAFSAGNAKEVNAINRNRSCVSMIASNPKKYIDETVMHNCQLLLTQDGMFLPKYKNDAALADALFSQYVKMMHAIKCFYMANTKDAKFKSEINLLMEYKSWKLVQNPSNKLRQLVYKRIDPKCIMLHRMINRIR